MFHDMVKYFKIIILPKPPIIVPTERERRRRSRQQPPPPTRCSVQSYSYVVRSPAAVPGTNGRAQPQASSVASRRTVGGNSPSRAATPKRYEASYNERPIPPVAGTGCCCSCHCSSGSNSQRQQKSPSKSVNSPRSTKGSHGKITNHDKMSPPRLEPSPVIYSPRAHGQSYSSPQKQIFGVSELGTLVQAGGRAAAGSAKRRSQSSRIPVRSQAQTESAGYTSKSKHARRATYTLGYRHSPAKMHRNRNARAVDNSMRRTPSPVRSPSRVNADFSVSFEIDSTSEENRSFELALTRHYLLSNSPSPRRVSPRKRHTSPRKSTKSAVSQSFDVNLSPIVEQSSRFGNANGEVTKVSLEVRTSSLNASNTGSLKRTTKPFSTPTSRVETEAEDNLHENDTLPAFLLTFPTPKAPTSPIFSPQSNDSLGHSDALHAAPSQTAEISPNLTMHSIASSALMGDAPDGGNNSPPPIPRCASCGFGYTSATRRPCAECKDEWIVCRLWYESRGEKVPGFGSLSMRRQGRVMKSDSVEKWMKRCSLLGSSHANDLGCLASVEDGVEDHRKSKRKSWLSNSSVRRKSIGLPKKSGKRISFLEGASKWIGKSSQFGWVQAGGV